MGLGGSGPPFPNRKSAERLKLSVSVARVENQLQSKKKKSPQAFKNQNCSYFYGDVFSLKSLLGFVGKGTEKTSYPSKNVQSTGSTFFLFQEKFWRL